MRDANLDGQSNFPEDRRHGPSKFMVWRSLTRNKLRVRELLRTSVEQQNSQPQQTIQQEGRGPPIIHQRRKLAKVTRVLLREFLAKAILYPPLQGGRVS